MHHRRFALALLLVAALLALTACSAMPFISKAPVATVRIAGFNRDPVMKALMDRYHAKHPEVKFELVPLSPGTREELTTLIDGEKVDIIPGVLASDLAKAHLIEPLDRYIQKDHFDVTALGRLEDLMDEGRLNELPIELFPYVLLYNQDLVRQAGLTLPDQAMTWEEFRETARRLTHGEGAERIWGYHAIIPVHAVEAFIRQNATNPQWWNDAQAVRAAFQFFSDLVWQDKSSPPATPLDSNGAPTYSPDEGFFAGKAALSIEELTALQQLTAMQLPLGAALLPAPAGRPPMGLATPQTLAIAVTTRNPDAAWAFMRFIASPDGAAIIAQSGVMPAYRTPETMDLWLNNKMAAAGALKPLATMPIKLIRSTDPSVPQRYNEVIRGLAGDVMRGDITWEKAFEQYKQYVPTAK